MDSIATTESIIDDVIGCGPFQIKLFFLGVIFIKSSAFMITATTVFVTYNPGWRCVDNVTTPLGHPNRTDLTPVTPGHNDTLDEYTMGSCGEYKVCRDIEFNPESSTIVTEWRLLCDKAWVTTLTFFVLMFGMLVGGLVGGQLQDLFGRKKPLRACIASAALLHLMSSFSVSWEMFVVLRFFIGTVCSVTWQSALLYVSEMMTSKWRATVMPLPTWQVIFVFVYLYIIAVKDWRKVEFFLFIIQVIFFIGTLWIPESLRWLGVKEKTDEFNTVATRMASSNRKTFPDEISTGSATPKEDSKLLADKKTYTLVDLLRKGYRLITVSDTFMFFALNVIYFGLTYVTVVLFGEFYINLLLMNIFEIPLICIAVLAIRFLSRRLGSFLFILLVTLCLFTTGVSLSLYPQSQPGIAVMTTVLASVAKGFSEGAIAFMYARTGELYPTVIRGLAVGWTMSMCQIGGMVAPLMIPNDQEDLAAFILSLGAVSLVCCVVSVLMPETKGKALKETF